MKCYQNVIIIHSYGEKDATSAIRTMQLVSTREGWMPGTTESAAFEMNLTLGKCFGLRSFPHIGLRLLFK